MATDKNAWITTYSGKKFYPLSPRVEDVDITDIAHSLSLKCRFAGHCKTFYSVAEHSVWVSYLLPDNLKMAGLLHDAAEAYYADIPRPIKRANPLFSEIEDGIMRVIAEKYTIDWPMDEQVKHADNIMLATEVISIMHPWEGFFESPLAKLAQDRLIIPMSPEEAENEFKRRFEQLQCIHCPYKVERKNA